MVPGLSGFATPRRAPLAVILAALVTVCGCGGDSDANVEHVDAYMRLHYLPPTALDRTLYRQVGTLVNGKRHGRWLTFSKYDPQKIRDVDHWKHGFLHGPQLDYCPDPDYCADGTLIGDRYYWNGKLHGRDRGFGEPGKLRHLGWVAEDKREGLWCYWDDETGELKAIRHYRRDRWTDREIEVRPGMECPHLVGPGKRHLDPRDRDYGWPRKAGRVAQRNIPLPL